MNYVSRVLDATIYDYFEDYEEVVKPKKQQQTRDDQYEIKPKQTKNKINKKIKELNNE